MMERVELTRDVDAIEIPAGHAMVLEKGTDAFVTQSLGGTYTLHVPAYGGLFRINGKDADAIGKEVTTASAAQAEGSGNIERQVWEQLKTCYDPEIPVNIVDLGLVYDLRVTSEPDGASRVDVKMNKSGVGHACRRFWGHGLLAVTKREGANAAFEADSPRNGGASDLPCPRATRNCRWPSPFSSERARPGSSELGDQLRPDRDHPNEQ